MKPAECNYDVHDKELLAIVQALKEWRRYVVRSQHKIRILTDHKNLVHFMTTKELNERQIRWSETLSQYDIKLEYRPGKEGGKPDALTRRSMDRPGPEDERVTQKQRVLLPPEQYFEEMNLVQVHEEKEEELEKESEKDEQIQGIKKALDDKEKEMKGVALGMCQWKDKKLWYQGKVWVPEDEKIRTAIIYRHHDQPSAGHGGTAKTTELISRRYYWPKMRETIKRYVKNCDACQWTKVVWHAPYGLLQPNEAPSTPWKSISMDFITDLPESGGHDAILVVIDRLTKMSHFIPCRKDIDAKQFAIVFLKKIFRLHGLPRDIITDRGSIFTSEMWKEITTKLNIERRLSTPFHPQTDGQTERTNGILEQYLCAYINYQQDDWTDYLPFAEFAYNNGLQETIKTTPFYANYGIHPEHEAIGHMIQWKNTPTEDMSQLHEVLRTEMVAAQLRQKEYYDQHRKPDPNLQSGDIVWFLPRNVHTTRPSRKLDYKKMGPYKILAKIGSSAYKLDFPPSMKIHNNINISLLEPYEDNKFPSQQLLPPPPIEIAGEKEYELENIIDSRLHYGKLQYRAKWTGYSPEHDKTWYPADNFENAALAVEHFHQQYPGKPRMGGPGTSQDRRSRRRMGRLLGV